MVWDPSDHCLLQTPLKHCGSEDRTNGSILVLTWAGDVSSETPTWTVTCAQAIIDLKINRKVIKMSKSAQSGRAERQRIHGLPWRPHFLLPVLREALGRANANSNRSGDHKKGRVSADKLCLEGSLRCV